MKRIISIVLAVCSAFVLCALFAGCSKKDANEVDAIMHYYVERMDIDMTRNSIEYIGKTEDGEKTEYHVKNEELGVDKKLFVEIKGVGSTYMVYDEDGIRLHIYNSNWE